MNVIIQINGREAIPVRALPLLAKWGTMHPQKIAGALGLVTDDDGWPLFELLHGMNAFYVEAGTVSALCLHRLTVLLRVVLALRLHRQTVTI